MVRDEKMWTSKIDTRNFANYTARKNMVVLCEDAAIMPREVRETLS